MATFAIGNIGEFNGLTETWKSYTERVKQYFAANEIANDKKVPALLAMMGRKTYSLLRNLTTPDDPATKGLDDSEIIGKSSVTKAISDCRTFSVP